MDLLQTNDNKQVIIKEILGNDEIMKLEKLGLCLGAEIKKYSGNPLSDVITIGLRERYFAITNTMAKKIIVVYADES